MALRFKIFDNYPELAYGHSVRTDGGMSKVKNYRTDTEGYKNRTGFLAKHRIDIEQAKAAGLVHSANVLIVDKNIRPQVTPDTDGFITEEKGLYLTVTVADCFPVYLYDPKKQVAGLVHAGWRGTMSGIIANAIGLMRDRFMSGPEDLKAGIGPGIQACHFEIKEDVLRDFGPYPDKIIRKGDKIFVDLQAIIRQQLLKSGLKPDNIEISGECTYCRKDLYFSYRRDKNLTPMLAFIGIREQDH